MSYRSKLERYLIQVEKQLTKMNKLTLKSLKNAMISITTNDDDLAIKVIEGDKTIDQLEIDIENNCVNLIALQQPMASDLREITAIMRIIADVERIADYANGIAKLQISFGQDMTDKAKLFMPMYEILSTMIERSNEAFIKRNSQLAREVAQKDPQVDQEYKEIYTHLLNEMSKNEETRDEVIALLFMGRYLERIGDHTVNICERIIYMLDGIREYF